MPPRDSDGNYVVKARRYVGLLCAVFTLIGSVVGGGVVFWSTAVKHGQEIEEAKQQRETVATAVKGIEELHHIMAEEKKTRDTEHADHEHRMTVMETEIQLAMKQLRNQ